MIQLKSNKCISWLTYATVILLHVVFELGSHVFESKSRFFFTEVRLDFSKISSITKNQSVFFFSFDGERKRSRGRKVGQRTLKV